MVYAKSIYHVAIQYLLGMTKLRRVRDYIDIIETEDHNILVRYWKAQSLFNKGIKIKAQDPGLDSLINKLDTVIATMRRVYPGDYVFAQDHNSQVDAWDVQSKINAFARGLVPVTASGVDPEAAVSPREHLATMLPSVDQPIFIVKANGTLAGSSHVCLTNDVDVEGGLIVIGLGQLSLAQGFNLGRITCIAPQPEICNEIGSSVKGVWCSLQCNDIAFPCGEYLSPPPKYPASVGFMIYPNSSDPGATVEYEEYVSDHVIFTLFLAGLPQGIVKVDGIVKEDSIYYMEYYTCEIIVTVETQPEYRAVVLNESGSVIGTSTLEPNKWTYLFVNPEGGKIQIYHAEQGELALKAEIAIPWTYHKSTSGPPYMGVSALLAGTPTASDWAAYLDFVSFGS